MGTAAAGGELGAGFGGAVGSVVGDFMGEEEREAYRRYIEQIAALYENMDPDGVQEALVELGPTAFEDLGLELDPGTREAQVRAYRAMMERGLAGGMDAESRAALSEAMTEAAQQESGARQALQQRFAARGRGGSMAELASQLANTQSAAEGSNRAATRAAGDASARAYQALAQGGSLAGQVRGQDYGQASDKASARDLVAQHNARNKQSVYGRNADRKQAARLARIAGLERSLQARAGVEKEEEERLKRLAYGIGSASGRAVGTAAGAYFGGGI